MLRSASQIINLLAPRWFGYGTGAAGDSGPPPDPTFLLLADGASFLLLADGTSKLILA